MTQAQPTQGQLARARSRADLHVTFNAFAWIAPLALFGLALAVRLVGMALVRFPMTEGSAYYTAVAANLASGRGFVVDAIWSYATPPLTLPRPAFELWQPLASLLAALPMPLFGASFASAQLAFAVVGGLVAPLTWFLARDAARRIGLPARRASSLSVGAGVLAAVGGPMVLAAAVPDSTLPFTVLAVSACIAMPAAVAGDRRALAALGVLAGLAYLTRMEAVYLAIVFAALGRGMAISWKSVISRGALVAAVAAVVALPWWVRNLSAFGTALPGQLADNAFLTRNEEIFAYTQPPTLDGFLGQGAATIALHVAEAFRHGLVNVLLIPNMAIVAVALISLVAGWRYATALHGSPLGALLILGALTLVATSFLFPVATLWGTFEHAAGPLLVALMVCAALGADALVARVRSWRRWPRSNAWLAPAALIALTVPLTLLQVTGASAQAREEQGRFAELGTVLPFTLANAGVDPGTPLITDRPMWLSDALSRPALALPDEPTASVVLLAREFGSRAVVVIESRGRHPHALAADKGCFSEIGLPPGAAGARLFLVTGACT